MNRDPEFQASKVRKQQYNSPSCRGLAEVGQYIAKLALRMEKLLKKK